MYICNENVKILNDLPMSGNRISSKKMVGVILEVEYYGEVYTGIEILEYISTKGINPRFLVRYNGIEKDIQCGNFLKGQFGNILGLTTKDFKVEIGQVFKDDKRDLIITDRKIVTNDRGHRKDNEKWYKYTCNKCGWTEGWVIEGTLLTLECRSSCCGNKKTVLGINTIWDTDRWMCDLGVSEEDAKAHTRGSNKKISVVCPDCKNKRYKKIKDIYAKKSIGCKCGDGASYPEKFMFNVLSQLNIKFETEYSPSYLDKKRSDFYIASMKLAIEVDGGLGHEGGIIHGKSDKTLNELVEIDRWKDKQHLLNGIETIRINCFKSDVEYIKDNILKSKLNELFDLSIVNWNDADLYAIKSNKVKEVCDYWNNKEEWETVTDLSDVFKCNRGTIVVYLKKGTKLGLCDYDGKEEFRKNNIKKAKQVEIFKDSISLGAFESCSELERQSEELFGVKLFNGAISSVCLGKLKHYKGYFFKYIE